MVMTLDGYDQWTHLARDRIARTRHRRASASRTRSSGRALCSQARPPAASECYHLSLMIGPWRCYCLAYCYEVEDENQSLVLAEINKKQSLKE